MTKVTTEFDQVPLPGTTTSMEDVVRVMYHYLKLSTLDRKFVHNLYARNVNKSAPVTTNQHDLMLKVIDKYRRQLAVHGFDADKFLTSAWTVPPVASLARDTNPWIALRDQQIVFYTPYREKFIAAVRGHNRAQWQAELREYHMPYTPKNLSWILDTIMAHYPVENYTLDLCQTIQDILDSLQPYEQCYWNPTLVMSKAGRYYIAATNEHVQQHLPAEFTDTSISPRGLVILTDLGITISQTIRDELVDKYPSWQVQFMATREPLRVEVTKLEPLTELFKLCGCNYIYTDAFTFNDAKLLTQLNQHISEWNRQLEARITPATQSTRNVRVRDIMARNRQFIVDNRISVVLTTSVNAGPNVLTSKTTRTIVLVDSTPIRIK